MVRKCGCGAGGEARWSVPVGWPWERARRARARQECVSLIVKGIRGWRRRWSAGSVARVFLKIEGTRRRMSPDAKSAKNRKTLSKGVRRGGE